MNRREFFKLSAGVGTVTLLGSSTVACGGPSMQVVRQAMPNPLVGVQNYFLAPVTWNGYTYNGQPEEAWLATRNERQRASWLNDKVAVTERFLQRFTVEARRGESVQPLTGPAPAGSFVIAINIGAYMRGKFAWQFAILDAGGQVVDQLIPPERGGGFGLAMELNSLIVLGTVDVLRYLRTRTRSA